MFVSMDRFGLGVGEEGWDGPMKFSRTRLDTVPLPPLLLIMYIWFEDQV